MTAGDHEFSDLLVAQDDGQDAHQGHGGGHLLVAASLKQRKKKLRGEHGLSLRGQLGEREPDCRRAGLFRDL